MDNSLFNLPTIIGLIIAITIHEFAHAYTADKFGDPTPRSHGRLSLNPLAHLDPVGTLLLFIVGFGWGKPVPIDTYNLTRKEETIVSLSGIIVNLVLASAIALFIKLIPLDQVVIRLLSAIIYTNIILAVFNLLPIPPLDGSKALLSLLPEKASIELEDIFDRYGIFILLFFVFIPINGQPLVSQIVWPIASQLFRLLI